MRTSKIVFFAVGILALMILSSMPGSSVSSSVAEARGYTCYFVAPTAGATVSGNYLVDFYGVYNGVKLYTAKIAVYKSGAALTSFVTMTNAGNNHWTINWDTTTFDDGSGYELRVQAYRKLTSKTTFYCSNLVIANGGTPPPPPPPTDNELTSGQTVTSSLAATGAEEMWTIVVGASCEQMYSVITCGSADFDLYGKLGSEPTTSSYDWRGYTSGGEEVTFASPGAGTWYIMVKSYSGTGSYDLTVTLTYAAPITWGTGGKYAVIVGISDYASISDLSYCDEDATDFYNFLAPKSYECKVYGDGHTSNYPRYDGTATEAKVRSVIQSLAAHAKAGDTVCFITSGHGSGDGNGESFLCMYDCSGSVGCYYDHELAADIALFASGVNIFIFIDHCYSGGMGPELMSLSNKAYIYCTTICTEDGYGYDDSSHLNGAWTYEFLEKYLSVNPTWSMETTFDAAAATYPHTGGDAPMEFDGNTGSYFYLYQ
jgi:hypothetical protein